MTILEILISIVVAGLVLAGVLEGVRFASNIARHTIYTTGAGNRAQEKVEEIKDALTGSLASIAGYDGQTEPVVIYSGRTDDTDDDINASRDVDIIWRDAAGAETGDPSSAAFAEVQVEVTWDVLPAAYVETVNITTNVAIHN